MSGAGQQKCIEEEDPGQKRRAIKLQNRGGEEGKTPETEKRPQREKKTIKVCFLEAKEREHFRHVELANVHEKLHQIRTVT